MNYGKIRRVIIEARAAHRVHQNVTLLVYAAALLVGIVLLPRLGTPGIHGLIVEAAFLGAFTLKEGLLPPPLTLRLPNLVPLQASVTTPDEQIAGALEEVCRYMGVWDDD